MYIYIYIYIYIMPEHIILRRTLCACSSAWAAMLFARKPGRASRQPEPRVTVSVRSSAARASNLRARPRCHQNSSGGQPR